MVGADDHLCPCGAFGEYGARVKLSDWRKGYAWRCRAHREIAAPKPVERLPPPAAKAPGGQGRLL